MTGGKIVVPEEDPLDLANNSSKVRLLSLSLTTIIFHSIGIAGGVKPGQLGEELRQPSLLYILLA